MPRKTLASDPVALLRAVGEAVHGARWQQPIARDLAVSDRLVRMWLAEERTPEWLPGALARLLRQAAADRRREADRLDKLASRVEAALDGS